MALNLLLTRSIRDSGTSIDFVQGPPGSRRERVKKQGNGGKVLCGRAQLMMGFFT